MPSNNERNWTKPSKRAKGYADDLRAKVHTYGKNKDEKLTDFKMGLRSGYLQCQSDHAGMYLYKKARDEGKSEKEAARLSRIKGKPKTDKAS